MALVLAFLGWAKYSEMPFMDVVTFEKLKSIQLGGSILVLFIALAVFYFVGHFIGAVSHIVYDRVIIRNVIGYPFQYLMIKDYHPKKTVQNVYLLLILFSIFLLVLPGFLELLGRGLIDNEILVFVGRLAFGTLLIMMLLLVLYRFMYLDKKRETDKDAKNIVGYRLAEFFKKVILYPIRKLTGTDSKIDDKIVDAFKEKFKNKFKLDDCSVGSDAFWIASMEVLKNEKIDKRLSNWLNLYGCLRNYSCAFVLLSIVIVINHWWSIIVDGNVTNLTGSRILLASLIVALVLFMRYWIIYYSYFSKYLMRAFVYLDEFEKI